MLTTNVSAQDDTNAVETGLASYSVPITPAVYVAEVWAFNTPVKPMNKQMIQFFIRFFRASNDTEKVDP
jgi:hypothetical protein